MTGGSHKEVNIWASPRADRPRGGCYTSILNRPLPDQGKHSAKTLLHLAKTLSSVTLGKPCDGKTGFAECFFSSTRQRFCREPNRDFAKCLTVQHSAKIRNFAEYQASGTRQSLNVCRVPSF